MEKLRIGIIGCGRISMTHIDGIITTRPTGGLL